MEEKNLMPMTIEEFNDLSQDNTRTYELIDGELVMQSRPNWTHQYTMTNTAGEIRNYLKGKNCKVFTEVELEINKNVIVPDISVVCNLNNTNFQRTQQPPVLVIEILNPSNSMNEINNKIIKYKNHGIKECWIIDSDIKSVEVKNLIDNTGITYILSGSVKSNVFPDMKIETSDIFD